MEERSWGLYGEASVVGTLFRVMLVVVAGWCSGTSLLQTIACYAWLQVLQPFWRVGAPLSYLSSTAGLVITSLLAAGEFIVEKIPYVNVRWTNFMRYPHLVGGAALSMLAAYPGPADILVLAAVVGLVGAVVSHSVRVALQTEISKTEVVMFMTPLVSTVESLLLIGVVLTLSQLPGLTVMLYGVALLATVSVAYVNAQATRAAMRHTIGLKP